MFRHWCSIHGFLALLAIVLLATAVPLVAPGRTLAQSNQVYYDATGSWRYYNGQWYHYKSYAHGYNPGYYARPDRVLPHGVSPAHSGAYAYQPPNAPGYAKSWPGPSASQPKAEIVPALPVYIEIHVPADAEIWFDDAKTIQTGTVRLFVSPPLTPGYDYTYEVRAKWTEDGQEVIQSRRITVHAGEQATITFPEVAPPKGE